MFDYIFYRLYVLYNKKEKGSAPISSAAVFLSFLQILTAFFIYMVVNISLRGKIDIKQLLINDDSIKLGLVIVAILLDVFNYFFYKNRIGLLLEKYRNSPLNRKFKVWMLYLIGTALFLFPFLYGALLKMLL